VYVAKGAVKCDKVQFSFLFHKKQSVKAMAEMKAKEPAQKVEAVAAAAEAAAEPTCDWAERVHQFVNDWYWQRAAELPEVARGAGTMAHATFDWRKIKKQQTACSRLNRMAGRLEDVLMGINCDPKAAKRLPKRFI